MVYLTSICAALLLLAPLSQPVMAQDLRDVVKTYVDSCNAHDIDKVLGMIADTIRYEEEGISERVGKSEFRNKLMWDKAVNTQIEVTKLTVKGSTVTGKAVEYSDYYTAAGIDQFTYDQIVIEFAGQQIKSIKVVPSVESNDQAGNVLLAFVNWGMSNRAADMNKLKDSGSFAFTSGTAPHWITLLKAWKASNQ